MTLAKNRSLSLNWSFHVSQKLQRIIRQKLHIQPNQQVPFRPITEWVEGIIAQHQGNSVPKLLKLYQLQPFRGYWCLGYSHWTSCSLLADYLLTNTLSKLGLIFSMAHSPMACDLIPLLHSCHRHTRPPRCSRHREIPLFSIYSLVQKNFTPVWISRLSCCLANWPAHAQPICQFRKIQA